MSIYAVTSDDTLTIYGRVFNDLSYDDVTTINFPSEKTRMRTGKNKNTVFAKDETGSNATLELHLIRGSSDDQFMQGKISESDKDFVATPLASGQFVKRLGDGLGGVKRDVYTLNGGVIVRNIDGKENVSGDTAQGVSVYRMMFAQAVRSIQ